MINLIERKLRNPKPSTGAATKRLSQIVRENMCEITQRALKEMKSDPDLGAISISDEQRIEFVPRTLDELTTMLESD